MQPFDIHIAYVSWEDDGKRRPILVLFRNGDEVAVFRITSQYNNKSDAVRSKYLAIDDWKQSGLKKPSFIDTSRIVDVPVNLVGIVPIGKLSEKDRQKLISFMK